jgi:K+-sensing histidine kinase KdpD
MNGMLADHNLTDRGRAALLAAVSHDLRTPLRSPSTSSPRSSPACWT